MATFPKSEMEIATLAENMISGFTANSEVYPAPVIPVEQLQNVLNELKSAQHQVANHCLTSSIHHTLHHIGFLRLRAPKR